MYFKLPVSEISEIDDHKSVSTKPSTGLRSCDNPTNAFTDTHHKAELQAAVGRVPHGGQREC